MSRDRMMLVLATALSLVFVPCIGAQNQGVPSSGGWVPRTAVKPDPGKIVVPKGYTVEVFIADLDSASAATVDGEDNVWVAISGNLFGPFEYEYGGQRIKDG